MEGRSYEGSDPVRRPGDADCHIEHAFIGPFSAIGANCHIVDTELENSILMPDCDIQGVPFSLDSSILGHEVVMRYTDESSARNRLILAD